MSINFSKFLPSNNPKPEEVIKENRIPEFLGGGAYNNVVGRPNKVYNSGHSDYGGEEAKAGQERDDIVPVALGGKNQSNYNIRYEKFLPSKNETPTDNIEKQAIDDYKNGKISLPEARLKVLSAKQQADMEAQGVHQGVIKNLLPAAEETVKKAAGGVGNFFADIGKSIFNSMAEPVVSLVNAGKNIKSLVTAPRDAQGKIPDYSNESYNLPLVGEVKPALTGSETPEEMAKKVIGYGADIASNIVTPGAAETAIKEVGKATLADGFKTALAKIWQNGIKNGGTIGAMNATGKSLEENNNIPAVIKNTLEGLATGATLGSLIEGGVITVKGLNEASQHLGALHLNDILRKPNKIINDIDPNIIYETGHNLAPLANGEKPLAVTEIKPQAGEAIIKLDKNIPVSKVEDVINNEHSQITKVLNSSKKVSPPAQVRVVTPETLINDGVNDLQGKTPEQSLLEEAKKYKNEAKAGVLKTKDLPNINLGQKESSKVYERLRKSLPEEFNQDLERHKLTFEQAADKASSIIKKDQKKAYRIAMGVEAAPPETTRTIINGLLSEKAIENKNYNLAADLMKNRALHLARQGQEIVTEKANIQDNSAQKYIKQVLADRLARFKLENLSKADLVKEKITGKKTSVFDIASKKEVSKVRRFVSSKQMDIEAAQRLIDSLIC